MDDGRVASRARNLPGMDARAALVVLFIALLAGSSGCLGGSDDRDDKKDSGESPAPPPLFALNLTYLDDTETTNDTWDVKISGSTDYGVLLVRNEGTEDDSADLEVIEVSAGWGVSLAVASVEIANRSVEPVVVTYRAGGGEGTAVIAATSRGDPLVRDIMTLRFVMGDSGAQVTAKGDQVVADYILRDENGTQLDAGTLPAIAGEPESGPAGAITYIDGFWLGLLGMEKGGGLIVKLTGETKTVKVPPELAYGTDPAQHELGGVWLYFTLTIAASE